VKYFMTIFFLFTVLCGEELDVDITANHFSADKSKNLIVFTGKVAMLKGEDSLYGDKLLVYTKVDNKTNKTAIQSYIATGHVNIKIKKPTTTMIGRGEKITYDADSMVYIIIGDGYLEDVAEKKSIKGEKIYYDEKNENTNIDGGNNKPVQFKLKIESK